jgi:membrane protein YqaA with SNARE-associated domain
VLQSLEAAGGIYVALFVVALISGVFPLVNSEVALALTAMAIDSQPKAIVLAIIVALGQSIMHSTLFFSGRGLAKVGAKRRPKLEAQLEKARTLVAKWGNKWLLLITLAATIGFPPMILVALAAGALGVRYPMFVTLDVSGRIARFITIALAADYLYG